MRLLIVALHLTKFYDNSLWEMYSQSQMLYRCISWYQPAHSKHAVVRKVWSSGGNSHLYRLPMSLRDFYESLFLTVVLLLCFRGCTLKQDSLEDDTVRSRHRGQTVAVWYAVEWTAVAADVHRCCRVVDNLLQAVNRTHAECWHISTLGCRSLNIFNDL